MPAITARIAVRVEINDDEKFDENFENFCSLIQRTLIVELNVIKPKICEIIPDGEASTDYLISSTKQKVRKLSAKNAVHGSRKRNPELTEDSRRLRLSLRQQRYGVKHGLTPEQTRDFFKGIDITETDQVGSSVASDSVNDVADDDDIVNIDDIDIEDINLGCASDGDDFGDDEEVIEKINETN